MRLIDRVIERIAPRATASACSKGFECISHVRYFYFCCIQGGCQYTRVGSC